MIPRYGNVTDTDDDEHRIMRDGETVYVGMQFMDGNSIQHGDKRMTTVSYTLTDGTEQSVTTNDAAAARAIQELVRQNEGLRGQIAAQDATIASMKAKPVQDAGATLRDHLRSQQAAQYDGSTDAGARAKALSDAWKQRPAS